jgi:head-tail adaptor
LASQPRVGALRWKVSVARRNQSFDAAGTGIIETWVAIQQVHADIQSVGSLTFYGAAQTDTPITHRITFRWLDYLDQSHAILRVTRLPNGVLREEVFRVRRVMEAEGRKRFSVLECELEGLRIP